MRKPTFNLAVMNSLVALYQGIVPYKSLLSRKFPGAMASMGLLEQIMDDREWIARRIEERTQQTTARQKNWKMRVEIGASIRGQRPPPVTAHLYEVAKKPRLPSFTKERRIGLAWLAQALTEWGGPWVADPRVAKAYRFCVQNRDYCVEQGWLEHTAPLVPTPALPTDTTPEILQRVDLELEAPGDRVFHVGDHE